MTALVSGLAWALGLFALVEGARVAAGADAPVRMQRILAPLRGSGGERAGGVRRLSLAAAICAAAGWLAGGPAGALLGCVAGPPGASAVAVARRRRRRRLLAGQAPPAARALAAALRGGNSLPAALALASRDGALDPAGRRLLATAADAMGLGAPTEDALGALARHAGAGPWPALVAGVLVQREAGGDLARLLSELAEDLERSRRTVAEARSASAQARLTARIVVVLPLTGALLVELAAPGTADGVLGDPLALSLVGLALALECAALLAVRRIARVER